MPNRVKGILLMVTSAFGFAVMNLLIPLVKDMSSLEKSFFRNFTAFFVALFIFMNTSNRKIMMNDENNIVKVPWGTLLLRSALGTIGMVFNYYTLDHLLISDAAVLQKLSPFATVIFSSIFLNEKFTRHHFFALLLAFVGVLFVIKPTGSKVDIFPYIIGIIGGFSSGAAYTSMRRLNKQGVNGSFIVLFFSLFSSIVALPALLHDYKAIPWQTIVLLFFVGVSACVGQYGITYAYKYASSSEISIFDYTNIIFTGIFGFIFLEQIPDICSIFGYTIILSGMIITYIYNLRVMQLSKLK